MQRVLDAGRPAPRRASRAGRPPSLQAAQQRLADAEYYYAVSGLYLLHPDAEGLILDFAAAPPGPPARRRGLLRAGQVLLRPAELRRRPCTTFQKVAPANLSDDPAGRVRISSWRTAISSRRTTATARLLFDRNKQGQTPVPLRQLVLRRLPGLPRRRLRRRPRRPGRGRAKRRLQAGGSAGRDDPDLLQGRQLRRPDSLRHHRP
ncbi:MAG: hypothetical protein WKG07_11710 [Hymenobacter sp.]